MVYTSTYLSNAIGLSVTLVSPLYPSRHTLSAETKALGKGLSFKAFHLSPSLAYPCLSFTINKTMAIIPTYKFYFLNLIAYLAL